MRSVLARPEVRRLARGPGASLASQATGLLQLALLLAHGGATNATDVYFYLFSVGLTPVLILVPGLMLPLLLNADRVSQSGLRRIRLAAPALACCAVAAGCGWLALHDRLNADLVPLALGMGLNSLLQGRVYFRATAAEASGNPLWTSGVALPANLAACLVLLIPWGSSTAATTAMVLALVCGNTAFLQVMRSRSVGQSVLDAAPVAAGRRAGSAWFLGRGAVGYVSQIVLSSLAVTLPASAVTLLSLAVKLVGAVSTTFTNALLPNFVHQSTDSPAGARRFLRLLLAGLGALSAVALVLVALLRREDLAPAAAIALWLLSSSAAAVAARMSYLFLRASAAAAAVPATILVVGLAVLASSTSGFGLTVLLCAYAALDAATALVLLWVLKDRAISIAAGCALASVATLALVSL